MFSKRTKTQFFTVRPKLPYYIFNGQIFRKMSIYLSIYYEDRHETWNIMFIIIIFNKMCSWKKTEISIMTCLQPLDWSHIILISNSLHISVYSKVKHFVWNRANLKRLILIFKGITLRCKAWSFNFSYHSHGFRSQDDLLILSVGWQKI